tara:strand:+ start:95 stop:904 length:810 start_codon:yes stop_codon:yes gene_type:complete
MKIALCYSGQIGAIHKAHNNQKSSFIDCNNPDVYCYTSDAVSQKDNTMLNMKPDSDVYEYLPGGYGWRENYKTYGIIYKINQDRISNIFKELYGDKLIDYVIEEEEIANQGHDLNMSKWQWMRMRQLHKLKACNEVMKKSGNEYDVVIRSRFEFASALRIDVRSLVDQMGGLQNIKDKIFIFGGFACTPPMIFMDQYFCDGFVVGTPEVMDIFCSLADKEEPYPPNPRYIDNWKKWGDSIEHQFRTHMLENNITIVYMSTNRADYQIVR